VEESLDGRRFEVVGHEGGEAGGDTAFEYHQNDDLVWARYAGGAIRLGFLVGRRIGDRLEFRYSHLTADGETTNGASTTVISCEPDGRLTMTDEWRWESKPGSGTAVLREVPSRGTL
jgi:hypothetical protein